MNVSPVRLRGVAMAGALAAVVATVGGCSSASSSSPSSAAAGGGSSAAGASSGGSAPAGVTTVKVGITGATAPPTFLPLIAQKFGLDTQNHIKIDFVTLTPNVTAQALSQGSADILAAPSVEAATVKGADFKIIAGAALSYWHFVAAKNVSSWPALSGKKIGLPCGVGATCVAYADQVLKAHGIDPTSVTFINGTAQGTYEAMAAGSVDAALTTAPYTYALSSAGKTHEFDVTGQAPYLSTQFTATSSYVSGNGAVVDDFVKAMTEAEAKLQATPISSTVLSAIDAFEKAAGINPATLDQQRFLTEFAKDKSWQLVPTKSLIERDLTLIGQADPTVTAAAKKESFDQMVYQVPEFAGQYG
jgi:ABC-type nitrate/sulfonate/bicarbonate transport system substrate-binding protein